MQQFNVIQEVNEIFFSKPVDSYFIIPLLI